MTTYCIIHSALSTLILNKVNLNMKGKSFSSDHGKNETVQKVNTYSVYLDPDLNILNKNI